MATGVTRSWILGLLGAAIGGVVGWFGYTFLLGQGFYALMLVAWPMGLGASLGARRRSVALATVVAAAALAAQLWAQYATSSFTDGPPRAEQTLGYFLSRLGDLRPMTYVMLVLGTAFTFWFALGRETPAPAQRSVGTRGEHDAATCQQLPADDDTTA